jgi:UrcA family protein
LLILSPRPASRDFGKIDQLSLTAARYFCSMQTALFLALAMQLSSPLDQLQAGTTEIVQKVRYDDLDLSSPIGRMTLDRRVESAIREVCENHGSVAVITSERAKACMVQARQDAAQKVEQIKNSLMVAQSASRASRRNGE